MYCSECGNKNIEGAKYCFKCGVILENRKAVNDEIEDVGVKAVVVDFKVTAGSNKKIGANGLKHKSIILPKKQVIYIIFVISIIVVVIASVVGVFMYENTHKPKPVSGDNKVIKSSGIALPDINLEKVIREQIKKPTGDILKGEVNKITSLSADERNITNLSGIENLTNLTELSLNKNEISNIEPLKKLTKLTALYITNNQISNIEAINGLTNMTKLSLENNKIKDYTPVKPYYNNLITKDFTLKTKADTDYILPNSNTIELKKSDLGNLTKQELTFARNEIYARHGLVFNTQYIKKYFESKTWYQTDTSYKGELNSIESFNVQLIKNVQEGNADNNTTTRTTTTSYSKSEVKKYVISNIFNNDTSEITNLSIGNPYVINGVIYYGIIYERNTSSHSVKLLCLDYTNKKTLSYDEMDKILAPLGKSSWDLQN